MGFRPRRNRPIDTVRVAADLAPGAAYTWKVRVWDAAGKPSDWSKPAKFGTGPKEWPAKWIGQDEAGTGLEGAQWIWFPEGDPAKDAPVGVRFFRQTVALPADRRITSAAFVGTADNTIELAINGHKAGEGVLAEAMTLDVSSDFSIRETTR